MWNKVGSVLISWLVNYTLIPLSLVILDYFRRKKVIRETKEKVDALKKAQTAKEKDEAINNMP
jgi:hypothetical protein